MRDAENVMCPHGLPLADNTCGPCSKGRPMRAPPECRWEEVDVNMYQTCAPDMRFFLRPDHELPEFCEHCGKPVVGVDPVE